MPDDERSSTSRDWIHFQICSDIMFAVHIRASAVDYGFRVRARMDFPGFGRRADMGFTIRNRIPVDIELPLKNGPAAGGKF